MTTFDIARCVQIAERTVLVPPRNNRYYDTVEVKQLLADQRSMIAQSIREINPTTGESK
jgi:hypothetical protein